MCSISKEVEIQCGATYVFQEELGCGRKLDRPLRCLQTHRGGEAYFSIILRSVCTCFRSSVVASFNSELMAIMV